MENTVPPKNKLVHKSEGNKENRYPDPDTNKTKINYIKEPNKAHKNNLKKKSCKKSLTISWRCY
jgi:hypothetical protein